jgi:transcriptional regulator with XRE-family HTH domain
MTTAELKAARDAAGMSQVMAAKRLGVTQSYLSLLERGKRRVPARLAARAAVLFRVDPLLLPLPPWHEWVPRQVSNQWLAEQLALLAYPGFAYMRSRLARVHPADLLMTGLAQPEVEPRVMEGLFWLLTRYWQMDRAWLVNVAKLHALQNKLGFAAETVLDAGRQHAWAGAMEQLRAALLPARLVEENTLSQRLLLSGEKQWVEQNRAPAALTWNLLTDFKPEHMSYVG